MKQLVQAFTLSDCERLLSIAPTSEFPRFVLNRHSVSATCVLILTDLSTHRLISETKDEQVRIEGCKRLI